MELLVKLYVAVIHAIKLILAEILEICASVTLNLKDATVSCVLLDLKEPFVMLHVLLHQMVCLVKQTAKEINATSLDRVTSLKLDVNAEEGQKARTVKSHAL